MSVTTIEQVVERLVSGYDPETIILFGSRAAGTARDDSDIDLLIIKETSKRPADRRFEVERLLPDRSVALDMSVYTPQEVWRSYANGSPFIQDVMETGRVLYMRKITQAWIAEATEDLESASILQQHGKYRAVCLHSQQCVEKTLKSLILEQGRRPPRTHDLIELMRIVKAAGAEIVLDLDDASFLTSIYRGRYPTEAGLLPHGEPTEEDARRALRTAQAAMTNLK